MVFEHTDFEEIERISAEILFTFDSPERREEALGACLFNKF